MVLHVRVTPPEFWNACRSPSPVFPVAFKLPVLDSSYRLPSIRMLSTVALPPCSTWMSPSIVEPRTVTSAAPSACRLPSTLTPVASKLAPVDSVMLPSTRVPFSVQVVSAAISRSSRVTAAYSHSALMQPAFYSGALSNLGILMWWLLQSVASRTRCFTV